MNQDIGLHKTFFSGQPQQKTSFLIEDILYSQQRKGEEASKELRKEEARWDKKRSCGYLQAGFGGYHHQGPSPPYIQVMGALNACLGEPYKTIGDPYFFSQGLTGFHPLFGAAASELSLNALKSCRRRKARTVFTDQQLAGETILMVSSAENLIVYFFFILASNQIDVPLEITPISVYSLMQRGGTIFFYTMHGKSPSKSYHSLLMSI